MSIAFSQNALSTTAEKVVNTARTARKVTLKNCDGSIIIYVGKDDTVTSSTGYPLKTNDVIEFDNHLGELYAIAASGTPSIAIIEQTY